MNEYEAPAAEQSTVIKLSLDDEKHFVLQQDSINGLSLLQEAVGEL